MDFVIFNAHRSVGNLSRNYIPPAHILERIRKLIDYKFVGDRSDWLTCEWFFDSIIRTR